MSKASEHSKNLKDAEVALKHLHLTGCVAAYANVTDAGKARIAVLQNSVELSESDAVRVGRWLLDTFAEPEPKA